MKECKDCGVEKDYRNTLKPSQDLNLTQNSLKSGPMVSLTKRKNPIGLVVTEILSFRQKKLTT